MADIYLYSFVEDRPSAEVAKKLVRERNNHHERKLIFAEGFPDITNGADAIKKKCAGFVNMAKGGLHTFCITDLDTHLDACELIREWFSIPKSKAELSLPNKILFRVAIREIESWILADRKAWAKYLHIAERNFSVSPDTLSDPKQHLLNILRHKGNRKMHEEMLPRSGTAQIGPRYNDILCDFIRDTWVPSRASKNSPSLKRAIRALNNL